MRTIRIVVIIDIRAMWAGLQWIFLVCYQIDELNVDALNLTTKHRRDILLDYFHEDPKPDGCVWPGVFLHAVDR